MKIIFPKQNFSIKTIKILFVLCLCLLSKLYGYSQTRTSAPFADKLFDKAEYYRAITEYERILYFDCNNFMDSIYCFEQIIKSYYRGKEYDNAISFIRAARTLIKNKPDVTSKFNYYLGICYLKLDMPYFALFYFEKNKMCLKSKLFAGISNIYLHNCDSAIAKFNTIITYNDETAIKDVAKRLIIYCTVGRRNGRKIPIVAGSLSVIPGLGYVYTKHYQSALSALMLNSLLLGSSYEFHKRGYKAVSITSLAIAITWYIGNIYGAIASAKRVNEKSEKDFFEEIFRGFPDLLEL